MRITLQQTASREGMRESGCHICERRFYLGPVTCWAITETNVLLGEVCPACVEGGAERIHERLEDRAWWSAKVAEEDAELLRDGITDCPTLDQLLAAESFYGGPMFETHREYDDALGRGDVSL